MHLHRDINGKELAWVIIHPLFSAHSFLSGLIPIASGQIKLKRTNIYKVLQFIRVNLPSV